MTDDFTKKTLKAVLFLWNGKAPGPENIALLEVCNKMLQENKAVSGGRHKRIIYQKG